MSVLEVPLERKIKGTNIELHIYKGEKGDYGGYKVILGEVEEYEIEDKLSEDWKLAYLTNKIVEVIPKTDVVILLYYRKQSEDEEEQIYLYLYKYGQWFVLPVV